MLNFQTIERNCYSSKTQQLLKLVSIDQYSSTPKHLQLVQGILTAMEGGFIKPNDNVPSLNELKDGFEISRDTAEKCYKHLRHMGVLESVPGKGYYIRNVAQAQQNKVMLLCNKLSVHKQMIYDALVDGLGDQALVDFHIYHNDINRFRKLVSSRQETYSHYCIIPHFSGDSEQVHEVINTIPRNKLILLDRDLPGISGDYSVICEDFEKDIYNALSQASAQLAKYRKIKVIYPENSYLPEEIISGVSAFCRDTLFGFELVQDIQLDAISQGDVFISLVEEDLVTLIEKISQQQLITGKQVGVISYNETPLKKLVMNGITTVSTDFSMMGVLAARVILARKKERIRLPFELKLRPSL